MSEKIYSLLLRLYPSKFRARYGNEALQLFRDRVRDEKGSFPGIKLWRDLLVDFAISLPGEYMHSRGGLAEGTALYTSNGVPAFHVLDDKRLPTESLVSGTLLTLLALSTFWILLGYGGRAASIVHFRPSSEGRGVGAPGPGAQRIGNEIVPAAPSIEENKRMYPVDDAERRRVVRSAASLVRQYYAEREKAEKTADSLLEHEKNGDDDVLADGHAFAALLTGQMREVSYDRHLTLEYSEEELPPQPAAPDTEGLTRHETSLTNQSCTFERVEILSGNIGYFKLNTFPSASLCGKAAESAMDSLNSARAMVFDLRENHGGDPAMVMLLAAYLFDHPEYMYNPRENTTKQSWTHSPVRGNKLADKPVFILTSASTASAAEHFSYDLKMLKRATIVGERTTGAAHSGVWHRIDDHFGMGVPETKAINPFSMVDWAEVGVEPDAQVKSGEALKAALRMARTSQQEK